MNSPKDWVKMRTSLKSHPKVNEIAALLEKPADGRDGFDVSVSGQRSALLTRNVTRCVTVTSLLLVWSAANEHTSDGVFRNVDLSYLDVLAEFDGFGEAMAAVGWAIFDAENRCVILPNLCENNVPECKRASTNAERQRRYRERQKANRNVTHNVTRDVTVTLDKIRKEDLKQNTHTARARTFPDSVDNFEAEQPQTQTGQGLRAGQGAQAAQVATVRYPVTGRNRNVTEDVTHNVTAGVTRNGDLQRNDSDQRYGDTPPGVTDMRNASGVTQRNPAEPVTLNDPAASMRTCHISSPVLQERFAMHPEWQPSSDLIQIAAEAGMTLDKLPEPAQIAEFRAFWRAEGKQYRQAQWDLKLAQRLVEGRQCQRNRAPRRDVNAIPDMSYEIPESFRGN